ncbi:hypothetical protein C8R47DRAFT_1219393 [Mycena vitilis]|nr:hypothetical protein C8R47DRAFT_1219393 [Mycena vitilis]
MLFWNDSQYRGQHINELTQSHASNCLTLILLLVNLSGRDYSNSIRYPPEPSTAATLPSNSTRSQDQIGEVAQEAHLSKPEGSAPSILISAFVNTLNIYKHSPKRVDLPSDSILGLIAGKYWGTARSFNAFQRYRKRLPLLSYLSPRTPFPVF